MPFPNPETQFPAGQSGNPSGYSKNRRIADALRRYLDEQGLEPDVIETWVGMALGMTEKLKGREPDFKWFQLLIERLDGKLPDADSASSGSSETEELIDSIGGVVRKHQGKSKDRSGEDR